LVFDELGVCVIYVKINTYASSHRMQNVVLTELKMIETVEKYTI
jgi:hypothetical protein